MSLEFGKPCAYEAKIKNEKGLNTKLIRNSSGTVEIPELGVKLEPGPFAEGFFTNMEGLLERVENVLFIFLKSEELEQKIAAKERLKDLQACREGKKTFTVIVKDPFGGSALIGEHVKKWVLSQKEAGRLKRGLNA
jgi:zinc finger protein